MPTSFSELFAHLEREVTWLHGSWKLYEQLYVGGDASRVDLMNRSASSFFRLAQDSIRNDIFISFGRLTDPASTSGKPNASLAGEKGAKILVFRVHTKGEPWRYLDEKPIPQGEGK